MPKIRPLFVAALPLLIGACGGDASGSPYPYESNVTAIIGGEYRNSKGIALRTTKTPDGDDCIDVGDDCAKPQKDCGDRGVADVLLDDSGAVVAVICYPTSGVSIQDVDGDLDRVGNNVVLVFDDEDDDVDVTGNVTVTGNNVTLYGGGPDVSVIGGNLDIRKNNALVRGIRVAGDVTIEKNNASIVDCVIEGNLTIRGNNTRVALCDVWGQIQIEANNTVLVSDRFAALPSVNGNNTVCGSTVIFDDANDDGVVTEDEVGEAFTCSSKSKNK